MVRFAQSASSSTAKWRYDRLDQQDEIDDIAEDAHASGSTAFETLEGEMEQVSRNAATAKKNEDAVTYVFLTFAYCFPSKR
jgi:hypothetical protein